MIAARQYTSTLSTAGMLLVTAALLCSQVMAPGERVIEPATVIEPAPVAAIEPVTVAEPVAAPVESDRVMFGSGVTSCGFSAPSGRWPIARPRPSSRVAFARATVTAIGDAHLDQAIVRRYLKRQHERIAYCFERHASPSGLVMTASFTITAQGIPAAVRVVGDGPAAARCIDEAIRDIRFPSPEGAGVEVSQPLTYERTSPATVGR